MDRASGAGVLAWAGAVLPLARPSARAERLEPPAPVRLKPGPAPWSLEEDGSLVIRAGRRLPPVGWSQLLCSARFGWLTDETGEGFLWGGGNAREGKLTPWGNDPLAVGGLGGRHPEDGGGGVLRLRRRGRPPCTVTFRPGLAGGRRSWGGPG